MRNEKRQTTDANAAALFNMVGAMIADDLYHERIHSTRVRRVVGVLSAVTAHGATLACNAMADQFILHQSRHRDSMTADCLVGAADIITPSCDLKTGADISRRGRQILSDVMAIWDTEYSSERAECTVETQPAWEIEPEHMWRFLRDNVSDTDADHERAAVGRRIAARVAS